MTDESQLQVRPKDGEGSLSLSNARSGLIARGLSDAASLVGPSPPEPTDWLSEIRRRAEKGDAEAQLHLGFMFLHGEGVAQDYSEAVRWLRKAADHGNDYPQNVLGSVAQNFLGNMYREGQGVPQDYAEAVRWYRKPAELRHVGALFHLGVMYDKGYGVPQDYAEAARLYREAADQGLASAQYRLGLMYHEGRGVPQDYAEAARLYREAAEEWDTDAQFGLGVLYYEGQGVPQDFTIAHMWLNLAASQVSGELQEVYAGWRDRVAGKMSAQQIAEAHRLAAAFRAEFERKQS